MTKAEKELQNQIYFLLKQYTNESINIHQYMALMGMAYKDFLEFHPEEQLTRDPDQLKRTISSSRTTHTKS